LPYTSEIAYRARNAVDRMFCRLIEFGASYERLATNFLGAHRRNHQLRRGLMRGDLAFLYKVRTRLCSSGNASVLQQMLGIR
jgi:hypothetical protein